MSRENEVIVLEFVAAVKIPLSAAKDLFFPKSSTRTLSGQRNRRSLKTIKSNQKMWIRYSFLLQFKMKKNCNLNNEITSFKELILQENLETKDLLFKKK